MWTTSMDSWKFLSSLLLIIPSLIWASPPSFPSSSVSSLAHGNYDAYYNQPSPSDTSVYAARQSSPRRFNREPPSAQVVNQDSLRFHRPSGLSDVRAELPQPLYPVVGSASDALKLESSSFGFLSSEEASDAVCHSLPGLSDQQRSLCLRNPGLVWAIVDGTQLGLYECVHQFRLDRWNCSAAKIICFSQSDASSSTAAYKVPNTLSSASGSLVNGLQGILKRGSRETAFVSAAWAAGAVQAITRACSRGRISTCDCDPMRREGKSTDSEGDFTWGGCSDPIRFGMRLTRLFLDSADLDLRDRINQRERDLTYQVRIRRVRGSDFHHQLRRVSRFAATQTAGSNLTVHEEAQTRQMSESYLQDLEEKLRKARMIKARLLMDLHNRKAGRRLVWQHREKKCKCHGVSGACSLRTCWQRVSQFRQVGNMLKKAYHNAIYATYDAKSAKLLRSTEAFFGDRILISDNAVLSGVSTDSARNHQSHWRDALKWLVVKQAGTAQRQRLWQNSRPKRSYPTKLPALMDEDIQRSRERSLKRYKNMLVYLESSPDYCNVDPGIGHLGIAGRQCSAEAADSPNSCDHICCGRGYETTETETREKCDCKFVWCCEVKCRVCRRKTLVHRCKRSQDDEKLTQRIQQLWNMTPAWSVNQFWNNKGYYIEAFD